MADGEESYTGPLSWRDVYKAVGDSESRVIQAIKTATMPLIQESMDHEVRLRAIETQIGGLGALTTETNLLRGKVDTLAQVNLNESSRQGVYSGIANLAKVAITIIASIAVAVAGLRAAGII